jgi:hypothetical protein
MDFMHRILITVLTLFSLGQSQTLERLADLRGSWKFSVGDNMAWAGTEFNDSGWDNIFVPAAWEDEGFPGYDGYAWYRKTVTLPANLPDSDIFLVLGQVDDCDQLYVNGNFIAFTGQFPPNYITAYQNYREYYIPREYLKPGEENVFAVRVFDAELTGGIVSGKPGLFYNTDPVPLVYSLEGTWKFTTGDYFIYGDTELNDDKWDKIMVPRAWETQGYRDYDGIAWYRKSFIIPAHLLRRDLVLILGKIDDLDQTYFNGELIGETGDLSGYPGRISVDQEWQELRAYPIPEHLINRLGENVIAVRVYDGLFQGGIFSGPIGLAEASEFRAWRGRNKREKGFFDLLFR